MFCRTDASRWSIRFTKPAATNQRRLSGALFALYRNPAALKDLVVPLRWSFGAAGFRYSANNAPLNRR